MTRFAFFFCCLATVLAISTRNTALAETPEVGQPAPPFELTDTSGQTHRLAQYRGSIVVVHFQSSRCPWDVAYQPILNDLANRFSPKTDDQPRRVRFLAINSNRTEDVEQLKTYAQQARVAYPILKDPGNKTADAYAARTTPHIYIISDDDQQTLLYKGGVEKSPLSPQHVGKSEQQYLQPVLEALLNDQPPPFTQTVSTGCSIKRE